MTPFMNALAFATIVSAASGSDGGGPMHVRVGGRSRALIVMAIAGAVERLESAPCERVLTDFADEHGRSLADNLAATGLPLRRYVSRLWAVDGDFERGCVKDDVVAFTAPGSHVIFMCSARFGTRSDGMFISQMTIIHELLHTLGLAENPPSSHQITRQVIARCRVAR
jgi:hypothetical protein